MSQENKRLYDISEMPTRNPLQWDILIIVLLTILASVFLIIPALKLYNIIHPINYIPYILLLLFLPGYAFLAANNPLFSQKNIIKRVVSSVIVSLFITVFLALLITYTQLKTYNHYMIYILILFTIILSLVAFIKRGKHHQVHYIEPHDRENPVSPVKYEIIQKQPLHEEEISEDQILNTTESQEILKKPPRRKEKTETLTKPPKREITPKVTPVDTESKEAVDPTESLGSESEPAIFIKPANKESKTEKPVLKIIKDDETERDMLKIIKDYDLEDVFDDETEKEMLKIIKDHDLEDFDDETEKEMLKIIKDYDLEDVFEAKPVDDSQNRIPIEETIRKIRNQTQPSEVRETPVNELKISTHTSEVEESSKEHKISSKEANSKVEPANTASKVEPTKTASKPNTTKPPRKTDKPSKGSGDEPPRGSDEKSSSKFAYLDLLLVLLVTVFCMAFIFIPSLNDSIYKTVLSFFLILFLPGYGFVAMIYPRIKDISSAYRLIFSFGISYLLTAVIALALDYTSYGNNYDYILLILSLLTVIFTLIALLIRWRVPCDDRFFVDSITPGTGNRNMYGVIILAVVVLLLAVPSYTWMYTANNTSVKGYSEFYVLGPNGTNITNYPDNLTYGENGTVTIVLVNHENTNTSYQIVTTSNKTIINTMNLTLQANEKREIPYNFTAGESGMKKLEFLLYKLPDLDNVYESAGFWLNIVTVQSSANATETTYNLTDY